MSTQAIRVPQPLTGEEIRTGIAVRISSAIEVLSEEDRISLRDSIWSGLGRTCSLNRQSYASFSAKWKVEVKDGSARWGVDYVLDDFGRPVTGTMTGSIVDSSLDMSESGEGVIESVPPDRFRRETSQPIPQPQIVQPKQENQAGITKSVGRPRKVRDT